MDLPHIVARSRSIVTEFRGELNAEVTNTPGYHLVRGRAKFVGPHELEVGGQRLRAEKIILAVGSRTRLPDVKGLENVRCLTNRELLELDELPEHLLILGGGYIACEFGQMFRRFGSAVTIAQKGEQLLDHEDKDIADAVTEFLCDEGIDVRVGCDLLRVESREKGFCALFSDDSLCEATHLLIATGQQPDTHDLGLEHTEIQLDEHGFVKVGDDLNAAPGIWALGDCKGGPAFTHIAYNDACRLAAHFLDGASVSVKNRPVPYTVFTDPQLGRIGLNECEARAKGVKYRLACLRASDTARGIETGHTRGFFKVLIGEDDRILGAAILTDAGGELMGALQIAMMGDLTADSLRHATFAHPTWVESFNLLFKKGTPAGAPLHRAE